MVDQIEKALRKLTEKERKKIKALLQMILTGDLVTLNVQKLKEHDDIFRVRKGDLRIIFRKTKEGTIMILALERRSESTYKDL